MTSWFKAPPVLVFPNPFPRGWPGSSFGTNGELMTLREALTRPFHSEAHMVQYTAEWKKGGDVARRLTSEAIGKVSTLQVNYLHMECDCPKAMKNTPEAQRWKDAHAPRFLALLQAHPGGYVYQTRNGFHVVYLLAPSFSIERAHDAARFKAFILAQVAYAKREFEIEFDDKCKDWQRFMRLPGGTRDGVPQVPSFLGEAP